MNKKVYITCYLITLVLVLLYLAGAHKVRSCRYIGFNSDLYIEIDEDPVIVHTEDEFCECGEPIEDFTGVVVSARPQYERGPLRAGFSFYSTSSFMWDRSSISISDWGKHTPQQFDQALQEAVLFAQNDRYYASHLPGSPPVTTLYPAEMARAGLGLIGVLFLPALVARSIGYMKHRAEISTSAYRLEHRLCVHCLYSTSGLNSEICPECGQPHSPTSESSA